MKSTSRFAASIYRHSPIAVQNFLCTLEGRRLERLRYGGRFENWARFYADSRGWSVAELLEYQREQVAMLLRYCYEHVPFYATRWREAGLSPSDFSDLSDLKKFPYTSKEDLFRYGQATLSTQVNRRALIRHTTGGSTGMPLVRYFTPEEIQRHYAIFWDRMRPGVKRGDRYAAFQGRPVVPFAQKKPPFWRENRAAHQRLYSIHHLSHAYLSAYAMSLMEEPFVYYQGYANFLAILAEFMAEQSFFLPTPPRAVFSTSEELAPAMRRLMENFWRTRVWNEYCQAERCGLIMECEERNHHVQMEYGVIEFEPIKAENGLTLAEIVCTGLIPRAAPLVRYRIGDRVLLDDRAVCPCGRPGPVIKAIAGRIGDYIVGPDGRIHPDIALVVEELRNVSRTQVVQERPGAITVRIVPFPGYTREDEAHLRRCFEQRLGHDMEIRVEQVRDLERHNNGKVFSIINRIPKLSLHRTSEGRS